MLTISINQVKFFASLKTAKFRKQHQLFIAEGTKLVLDLIKAGLKPQHILASNEFFEEHHTLEKRFHRNCIQCSEKNMGRITALKSPSPVYACFQTWESTFDFTTPENELVLLLDQIKDPGNMGTIIRTADWYGIKHIVCVNQCVDKFNPKLIQATMGSISRVKIYDLEVEELIQNINANTPVYGTLLEGKDIYQEELHSNGYIITGNESKGISESLIQHINHPIHIPAANALDSRPESLNASIATAIVCSEFYRQQK